MITRTDVVNVRIGQMQSGIEQTQEESYETDQTLLMTCMLMTLCDISETLAMICDNLRGGLKHG